MTSFADLEHKATEEQLQEARDADIFKAHVVVCLAGLSVHTNGSPTFSCKVYGPFHLFEVDAKAKEIQRLEGGACLVRPLVDLADTYRRMSAD